MIATVASPWSPKLLWLLVPSFGGAMLWWYIVEKTLRGEVGFTTAALPNLLTFLVFGVFALGLWLGAFGLTGYMVNNRTVRFFSALLVTLPVVFWFPLKPWTLAAFGLTFVAGWWGIEQLSSDQHNRLTVRPQFTLSAFSISATVIMMAVSLLYYQQLRGSSHTSQELAQRLSSQTVTFTERFLPSIYKNYHPNQTVDELLLAQFPTADEILKDINFSRFQSNPAQAKAEIRDRLSQLEIDPTAFNVSAQATEAQIREELGLELERQRVVFVAETRDRLSTQLGIPIRGNEKVHDVLTSLVNKQFDQSIKQYVQIIPWLFAAALFFLLKIFTGVFTLAITWIGWILFRLYRSIHVIRIDHEMVPAEKVVWF